MVTQAKIFAENLGTSDVSQIASHGYDHLDVDISDSLAAITAATSNGQLSAVLDAASSVTASNTSLADAVALSADTHVAHSTVDFVQLAESARDNTSYSAQEYVVAISANVTNPISSL